MSIYRKRTLANNSQTKRRKPAEILRWKREAQTNSIAFRIRCQSKGQENSQVEEEDGADVTGILVTIRSYYQFPEQNNQASWNTIKRTQF